MVSSIILLIFVAFLMLFGGFVFCIGLVYMLRKSQGGGIQFMDKKDWRRVRTSLNQSHEETQVAVATDHLKALLADE